VEPCSRSSSDRIEHTDRAGKQSSLSNQILSAEVSVEEKKLWLCIVELALAGELINAEESFSESLGKMIVTACWIRADVIKRGKL